MSDDFWPRLRAHTPARIGLIRAGSSVSTRAVLDAGAAHAAARDAVHAELDVDALAESLASLGLGAPTVVASAAPDRATYLTRPDLGRTPADSLPDGDPADLAIVVADGLSADAVTAHATPLLRALLPQLDSGMTVATPAIATGARVALGDHIGASLSAAMVLVLIGERPGLSSIDSLGAYLTWNTHPGIPDSGRNCVSNIHPPVGLDYATAARVLAALIVGARRIEATGVRLKDTSGLLEAGADPGAG